METEKWAHLLERAGTDTFVGRQRERHSFERFLRDEDCHLLHVTGPAGIGKTALLHEFCRYAREHGWKILWLDAAAIETVASKLEEGLAPALQAAEDEDLLIAVDEFDHWQALHRWMRQDLLRRLPSSVHMVTAARSPLDDAWLTAPGWEKIVDSFTLSELSDRESLELLEVRGVGEQQRAAVAQFAQGHPLALTVAADVVSRHPDREFSCEAAVDDLRLLLRRLLSEAPSRAHRQAMKLASLVRRTTEPLLADVLDVDDASELLRWLAERPFFSHDERGFSPHDSIRRLLNDEMRLFEERQRERMLRRAMSYFFDQAESSSGEAYEQAIIDLGYLLRDDIFNEWAPVEAMRYYTDTPTEAEFDQCVQTVCRFEGEEAAKLARHWQQEQSEGLVAVRDAEEACVGFCHFLDFDRMGPDASRIDPAIAIVEDYLDEAPLREGETARICRFWMATDTYQDWSGAQTRMFVHIFHRIAASAGVAVGLTVHAHPKKWVTRPENRLEPLGQFELDETPFVVFAQDWRKIDRTDWLRDMVYGLMGAPPRQENTPTPTLLSRENFKTAVKQALKHFHRGDRLKCNPMLETPLVLAHCDDASRPENLVETLRELLEEACHSLGETGGDKRHVEVLDRTYLQSNPKKQKAIAEELGMAYSTLRYHLGQAVDRVVDHLWTAEQELIDV
ncbi:hypothetical protein FIV42_12520 [Persicimonas caeni]|uniref:Novel STAND NTPase 5 domain-containing protein n=1 Tax=Persicimonas caeni TaxID=2292766 RepID=A0A4Y6PTU0_PERCE|nr:AAA family ATPase [Persicimonas caeni]QDG51539.1 hypothetical protein FIV42_12520 [Persicimonas caeni]QED32760.1 hypothetical protein FRD00_12515 [Persicimonas caeni]